MSQEEEFLSKIERSPGDESARLVYADWLEDRGDRRAALLRARQGALPAITTGLTIEPGWLARIDRTAIERCDYPDRERCPKRWEALSPGDSPRERRCEVCQREVHHCASIAEAVPLVEGGLPVSVSSIVPRHPYDLVSMPEPPMNPPRPFPSEVPTANPPSPIVLPEPIDWPGPVGPPGNPPKPNSPPPPEAKRWWQFWRRDG